MQLGIYWGFRWRSPLRLSGAGGEARFGGPPVRMQLPQQRVSQRLWSHSPLHRSITAQLCGRAALGGGHDEVCVLAPDLFHILSHHNYSSVSLVILSLWGFFCLFVFGRAEMLCKVEEVRQEMESRLDSQRRHMVQKESQMKSEVEELKVKY